MPRLFRETREIEEQKTKKKKRERIQYSGRNKKIGDNPIGEREHFTGRRGRQLPIKGIARTLCRWEKKKPGWKRGRKQSAFSVSMEAHAGSCAATGINALVPSPVRRVNKALPNIFIFTPWGYVSLLSGCLTRIYLYQWFYDVSRPQERELVR